MPVKIIKDFDNVLKNQPLVITPFHNHESIAAIRKVVYDNLRQQSTENIIVRCDCPAVYKHFADLDGLNGVVVEEISEHNNKIRTFPAVIRIYKGKSVIAEQRYLAETPAHDKFEKITESLSELSDRGGFRIQMIAIHPESGELIRREIFSDELPLKDLDFEDDVAIAEQQISATGKEINFEQPVKKPLFHFVAVKNNHNFNFHASSEYDARIQAFSELGGCSKFYQKIGERDANSAN